MEIKPQIVNVDSFSFNEKGEQNMIQTQNNQRISIQNILFFDIETSSQKKDYDQLDERQKKMWNKRFESFKSYNPTESRNSSAFYDEKAAIFPEYGQIVNISYGYLDSSGDFKVFSLIGEEENILKAFFMKIESLFNQNIFYYFGGNVMYFDIPYIVRKALSYGIMPPERFWKMNTKPWESNIIDIISIWRDKSRLGDCTIEAICYTLGIESPKDEMDGSMVSSAFWEGKIEEIAKYGGKDVYKLYEIALKLTNLKSVVSLKQ